MGSDPLEKVIRGIGLEAAKDKWKLEDKHTWVDRFMDLSNEEVNLHAKWLRGVNPIISCGRLFWVPLIGARGCVPYCPALILRQFCIIQVVPATFGMTESSLLHSAETLTLRQYASEWEEPYCLEGHVVPAQPTQEYMQWRVNRVNGTILPHPMNKRPMEEEGESHTGGEVNYITHAQLLGQLRMMREERDQLALEREKLAAKQMNLELKVHGLERRNRDNIRMYMANHELALDDFKESLDGQVRKEEASSAIIKDKDSVMKILTAHANKKDKENQALRARVAALEAKVMMQEGELASWSFFCNELANPDF